VAETSVSKLVDNMSRNTCLFPGSNITCFTFYIHVTYLLTLPRAYTIQSSKQLHGQLGEPPLRLCFQINSTTCLFQPHRAVIRYIL
jgi:hypothetical protein